MNSQIPEEQKIDEQQLRRNIIHFLLGALLYRDVKLKLEIPSRIKGFRQLLTLLAIQGNSPKGINIFDLAARLQVSWTRLEEELNTLLNEGLIQHHPVRSSTAGTNSKVRITPKGQKIITEFIDQEAAGLLYLFSRMNGQQRLECGRTFDYFTSMMVTQLEKVINKAIATSN